MVTDFLYLMNYHNYKAHNYDKYNFLCDFIYILQHIF